MARLLQQKQQHQQDQDTDDEDYEPQMSHIIDKLENKMEQIQVVKQLLESTSRRTSTKPSFKARMTQSKTGHVKIVTKTKSKDSSSDDSTTGTSSQENLRALRNIKMLQKTLQRDDLSWNWIVAINFIKIIHIFIGILYSPLYCQVISNNY